MEEGEETTPAKGDGLTEDFCLHNGMKAVDNGNCTLDVNLDSCPGHSNQHVILMLGCPWWSLLRVGVRTGSPLPAAAMRGHTQEHHQG